MGNKQKEKKSGVQQQNGPCVLHISICITGVHTVMSITQA